MSLAKRETVHGKCSAVSLFVNNFSEKLLLKKKLVKFSKGYRTEKKTGDEKCETGFMDRN